MNKFYYLGAEERNIEGKAFLKVSVLELERKQVFNIYKIKDTNFFNKISVYKVFDDITEKITYVIKSNGKIGLDIK